MAYSPYQKAALLIPFNDVPHIFAILNDPCPNGLCLLLMVTSIKPKRVHDPTCVLREGDHKFINKPSFILHRIASHSRAAHIYNMVGKGYYRPHTDFREDVFRRIADGIYASDDMPQSMLAYAQAIGI